MIKNLLIAGALATAPITINNSQSIAIKTISNNIGAYQDGYTLTNANGGNRYFCTTSQKEYYYNIIKYEQNTYTEMIITFHNGNTYYKVNQILVQRFTNIVDYTIDSIEVKNTKMYYTFYSDQYINYATKDTFVILQGEDQTIDDYIDELIDTTTFTTEWTNILTQSYYRNIVNYCNSNNIQQSALLYKNNSTLDQAKEDWTNDQIIGQEDTLTDIEENTQQVLIKAHSIDYLIEGEVSPMGADIYYYNPIRLTFTWDAPPITQEIVDIPGLMLSILGMPFAFISQAFNLTIFPNTPYSINLSHLFLALICAGILIFIIKKVIR